MAADYGVHAEETFTGFKWIGRTIIENPDRRFMFGYEQALGYLVAQRPLDKDGITAAVVMVEVAACAASDGTSIEGRLESLVERYGRYVTGERSIKMDPALSSKVVQRLQAEPPPDIGGVAVDTVTEFPRLGCFASNLLMARAFRFDPAAPSPRSSYTERRSMVTQPKVSTSLQRCSLRSLSCVA